MFGYKGIIPRILTMIIVRENSEVTIYNLPRFIFWRVSELINFFAKLMQPIIVGHWEQYYLQPTASQEWDVTHCHPIDFSGIEWLAVCKLENRHRQSST